MQRPAPVRRSASTEPQKSRLDDDSDAMTAASSQISGCLIAACPTIHIAPGYHEPLRAASPVPRSDDAHPDNAGVDDASQRATVRPINAAERLRLTRLDLAERALSNNGPTAGTRYASPDAQIGHDLASQAPPPTSPAIRRRSRLQARSLDDGVH